MNDVHLASARLPPELVLLPALQLFLDSVSNWDKGEPVRERHFNRCRLLASHGVGGQDDPVLAVPPFNVRAWNGGISSSIIGCGGWSARLLAR